MKRITLKETKLVNLIKRVINEQSFQYTPNTQGDPSFQHWQCAMMVNMGCNVNCSGAGANNTFDPDYECYLCNMWRQCNSITSNNICNEVCSPEFYDKWTNLNQTGVGVDIGHAGPAENDSDNQPLIPQDIRPSGGKGDMSQIRARALSESDLTRLIKRVINEHEANRRMLGENWKDTSWEDEDGKITIGDISDYIGNDIRNISVSDLQNKLKIQPSTVTQEKERIMKADLQYPIILVQKDGEFSYVLDGNHRLAKAIMTGEEYIKAKVLYLDDKNTPEEFKRLL